MSASYLVIDMMRYWMRVRLDCSPRRTDNQEDKIAEAWEYKEIESNMIKNGNKIEIRGLDTGRQKGNRVNLKQEAAETKYSMKPNYSNVMKNNKPSEVDLQQAGGCGTQDISCGNPSRWPHRKLWAMFGTPRIVP